MELPWIKIDDLIIQVREINQRDLVVPKKALNIDDFSGGLNDNTNNRDIENHQFSLLNGVDIEYAGKIKTLGKVDDTSGYPVSSTNDHVTSSTIHYGNGLLHLNLDRRVSSAVNSDETQYLFINDPSARKVRILDIDNNTLLSSGDYIMTYGSAGATSQVEYTTIDGEVRVSPYVNGTLPFLTTNQIQKLSLIKTIKTLGIDVANLTAALEGPTTYASVYKTGPSYISPIKCNAAATYGYPDGYGYDISGVMGTSTWFSADNDSEATCNTTFVVADIDNLEYAINRTLAQVTTNNGNGVDLDTHTDWSGGYGGLELAIWTGSTVDASSDLYNFYSTTNAPGNDYEIFASNVYKNQESVAVHIGTVMNHIITNQTVDKKVHLYYCILGRVPKNPFQSGINYYWARKTDGEVGQKYLLFEVDFEKGYRKGGEKLFEPFTESHSGLTGDPIYTSNPLAYSNGLDIISGINKKLLSLPDLEPYLEKVDTAIGRLGTGYKTSVILNRRAYVANVGYYDKKSDDATYIKNANDTIIKSDVNEFDYFPLDNLIDVEINDGESIVKLASIGDKLLEYKQNTLYIINCSRDIEYLEGTYKYKGVSQPYHVVEGEGFVAWINQYGVYLYDGERISNILMSENSQKRIANWDSYFSNDNNVVGYIPHKQTLYIANKNGKILFCDLKTFAWFYSSDKFPTNDITNFANLNDGRLVWYENQSGTLKVQNWLDTPQTIDLDGVLIQTKEYTFLTPDIRKKIHSVYINHKYGTNIDVYGYVDGNTTTYTSLLASGQSVLSNTSSFSTQRIPVSNGAFKDIKSFGLVFKHDGDNSNLVNAGFELNDIQIVYREKTRK